MAMAPHSSTLAWKIPWAEEPGGLQSMGSLSRTRLSDFTFALLLFNHSVTPDSLWPHGLQHVGLPCPLSPRACSNPCPSSRWCHPTISSSVVPFSSCLQSFPAPGPFQMSQLSASGGQSIGVSVSAPVLPVNIQGWFPSGLTGLVFLLSKGLSGIFSSTTVRKYKSSSALFCCSKFSSFCHQKSSQYAPVLLLVCSLFCLSVLLFIWFSTSLLFGTEGWFWII